MNKLIGLLFAAALSSHLSGAVITYNVTVGNTSAIPNSPPAGKIFFDFGANSGTVGANQAVISAFTPAGQLGAVDAVNSAGSFSGSLATAVTLTSTNPSTVFAQNYNYNGGPLSFQVKFTTAPGGTAPTIFDFALTDSAGNGYLTADPNGNLFTVTIDTAGNVTSNTYLSSAAGGPPAVSATVLPEPGSLLLLSAGAGVLLWLRRR